jgi:hypothetical protein
MNVKEAAGNSLRIVGKALVPGIVEEWRDANFLRAERSKQPLSGITQFTLFEGMVVNSLSFVFAGAVAANQLTGESPATIQNVCFVAGAYLGGRALSLIGQSVQNHVERASQKK